MSERMLHPLSLVSDDLAGAVYRVRYTKTDQIYALKIIALGLLGNETAQARFEREAKILQQLKHPNIVRLFANGRYKGTPFFAMEYVDGKSLDRVMVERIAGVPGKAPFTSFQSQIALKLVEEATPLVMPAGNARPMLDRIITRGDSGGTMTPAPLVTTEPDAQFVWFWL